MRSHAAKAAIALKERAAPRPSVSMRVDGSALPYLLTASDPGVRR